MSMGNALHPTGRLIDVKASGFSASHTPYMDALVFPFWHHGFDHVATLKAKKHLLSGQITSGKAVLVKIGALVLTPSHRFNKKHLVGFKAKSFRGGFPYADTVMGVCFW